VLRRYLTTVLVAAGVVAASACGSNAGNTADRDIRLDYAYYNPLSLVVRDQRLLENRGYNVTWVLSAGSNKANEGARPRGTEGHLALP
jgi:sulfonate transport system substrate-binding protein